MLRLQTLKGNDRERLQDLSTPTTRRATSPTSSDEAQQTIYFRNTQVEPSNDYTYDAIYQLIEATGREHLGQTGQVDQNDPLRPTASASQQRRGDAALYREYEYDAVGNILKMLAPGHER